MQNSKGRSFEKPAVQPGCIRLCLPAAALIIASIAFQGCRHGRDFTDFTQGSESGANLTGWSEPVESGSKAPGKRMRVMREGERKDSLVLVAPAAARISLDGVSGKRILEFWATPVFNIGDGIQMSIFLRRAGTRLPAGSRYFDAGRNAEHRRWIQIAVPLEVNSGDQLEIEVSAGPQGDLVGDWLALSSPRLVS